MKTAHKILGYALILFSQLTIISGVNSYIEQCKTCDVNAPPVLGIIAIALYLSVWFALETQYQIKIRTVSKDSSD